MPVTIDGTSVSEVTIDGTVVKEITMDGNVVYSAQTYTLVDSFEDADIAEYGGDTTNFSVTTNNSPKDGSYRLERGADGYAQIQSTSGLNAYPKQGDKFRTWVYLGDETASTTYTAFLWAVQDGSNFYYCRAKTQADEFELVLPSGTTSTAVTLSTNAWYEYVVEWDDGTTFGGSAGDHTVYLLDSSGNQLAKVTGNDTSYTSGGIGWGVTEGPAGADFCRITNR